MSYIVRQLRITLRFPFHEYGSLQYFLLKFLLNRLWIDW